MQILLLPIETWTHPQISWGASRPLGDAGLNSSDMEFMFYLHPLPVKTLILLRLHLLHFHFHAEVWSPHLTGHIFCPIFHISHLTTGDLYHFCSIFFHLFHIFSHLTRGESPNIYHIIFLISKYLWCPSAAITSRLFCPLILCIHLLFHFKKLAAGITPRLFHCLVWLHTCLSQLLLQTMHLLQPVLAFIIHHLFQYCNIFLVYVNGTLVIWCLIVCLGFGLLELVIHICHSTLQSLLWNDLVPFILSPFFSVTDALLRLTNSLWHSFIR